MQINEHRPGNYHFIRGVDARGIRVDDQIFQTSLIIGARLLKPDWPVRGLGDLDQSTIQPLIALEPELVVIGCGQRQQFPAVDIQRMFLSHGIGFECMTLAAACRTFNILMSENRRALAALILPEPA